MVFVHNYVSKYVYSIAGFIRTTKLLGTIYNAYINVAIFTKATLRAWALTTTLSKV